MTNEPIASPYYHFFKEECGPDEAWMELNGYHTPLIISDVEAEAHAGREATALFDVTMIQKLKVGGPDAGKLLDYMCVRQVSKMKSDRVAYVATTDENGRITDDGTLFRYSDEEFILNTAVNFYQHATHLAKDFQVRLSDVSQEICGLAVYGKTAYSVLQSMGIEGLDTLKAFQFARFQYQGSEILISRTGFTGDLGYEIWASNEMAEKIGSGLIAARDNYQISFSGLSALDSLRMEAGFFIPGFDFTVPGGEGDETTMRSAFDMDLDWMVQIDRDDFIGKEALIKEKEQGSRWQYVSVVLDTPDNLGYGALYGVELFHESGDKVGRIGAGTYSPNMSKNIGVANVEQTVAIGSKVLVGEDKLPATVKQIPLFNTERRTEIPPAFYEF